MQIDFDDQTKSVTKEQLDFLQELLHYTAKEEGVNEQAEVSICFVNNEEIREINKVYRNQDKATDVISFAMQEIGVGETIIVDEGIPFILGDIIISIEKAAEQAEEYKHSFQRELAFLIVHGFLHLLGYDHLNEVDEQEMFARQTVILDAFNLGR